MNDNLVPVSTAQRLLNASQRLQTARKRSLSALDVTDTEWEYAGRSWSWPGGEELTYFQELAPGEQAIVDELVSQDGFDLLGVGTGRVTVSLPEIVAGVPAVAKLARYGPSAEMGAGRPQNRREVAIWGRIGEHPFLPVLDANPDNDWVVMPEADVLSESDPEADTAIDAVRTALTPHQSAFHFDELKAENIGGYDDAYWIVDYGRPPGEELFVTPPESEQS